MKIFITDNHINKNNIELQISIFKQAFEFCKKNNVNEIHHGGDWYEQRSSKQDFEIKRCIEYILDLAQSYKITIISLVSNHDKVDYKSKENWLSQYKHHPSLNLIEDVGFIDYDEMRLHFISYFDEKESYETYLDKAIENIDSKKKNILLTHVGITGVRNLGHVCENDLPIDKFLKFDKVLVGHFHERQELKDGKIVYFGSAFQANYGETPEKGLYILHDDLSAEYVNLKFPIYKNIEIDANKTDKKEIDVYIKQYGNSNDNIRFTFVGSESKIKSIDKDKLTALGIDVKKVNETIQINEDREVVEQINVLNKDSIKEKFNIFCKEKGLDVEEGTKYLEKQLN